MKVLIVEDSAVILERMDNLLSELECVDKISSTSDGKEAITMMEIAHPDVVLLDINLPNKSGISILKEIKMMSQAKVIMLTNYSDSYYRNLCISLGADHFLDKSTEFEKIPAILTDIFNKVV